jgi:hypothetical protein
MYTKTNVHINMGPCVVFFSQVMIFLEVEMLSSCSGHTCSVRLPQQKHSLFCLNMMLLCAELDGTALTS